MDIKDCLQCYVNEEVPHDNTSKAKIYELATKLNALPFKDESRSEIAHKDGGKQCINPKMVSTIRSVGKHVLADLGKKIMSGNLNLTKVSFPIQCSVAMSALERVGRGTSFFPIFFNKAASQDNQVERMKLVITATLANFYVNCTFLKPLNPILGETFQGNYNDGTQVYCEQISHHPPISSYYCVGPNKSFICHGHYTYETNAGMNSLTLKNTGHRTTIFPKDGQKIEYNFGEENYSGIIMGTMKIESKGTLIFIDKKNGLEGTVILGKVKKKPSDYFEGEIKQNQKVVSNIYGSYMSFVEFDNQRYWDYRVPLPLTLNKEKKPLISDGQNRADLQLLSMMALAPGQKAKEELEIIQRKDANLRKEQNKAK